MRAEAPDSPDAVSFLTALLVSYPEIGSARLTDGGSTLVMEFFLAERLATARLREFAKELREAVDVFAELKRVKPKMLKSQRGGVPRNSSSADNFASVESFEASEEYERADSLQILRDLATVTLEEFSLVVELVAEEFERDLVMGEEFEDDDDGYHAEVLESSLERIRFQKQETDLIGFRDDLRVLVYASDEDGPRRR